MAIGKHSFYSVLRAGAVLLALLLIVSGCEEARGIDPRERAQMQVIFDEARQLDEMGRYHEALVRYETVLARHPEFMSTRLNAAMSAYDAGEYDKARVHFEVLLKYSPSDWFVIRKLIQCNERLGNTEAVALYRAKLERLRKQAEGSVLLKKYEGLTRDYIPIGTMHLIGYEFFDPKQHGRLWFFRLEDRNKTPVTAFLLEATQFHDNDGHRLFSLTEATNGWLRIWYVGDEGRDYEWTRAFVLDCLHGKRTPLVTRSLPSDYEALAAPDSQPVEGEKIPKEGGDIPPPPAEKPGKEKKR